MTCYYIKNEYGYGIGSTDKLPIGAVEISQEEFDRIMSNFTTDKRIWMDKSGNLQLRDRLTKYNEGTDTWIPDEDAIAKDKQDKFISSAQIAYTTAYKYTNPYEWSRLSADEITGLTAYLDALSSIIDGTSQDTELPVKPNFIKG